MSTPAEVQVVARSMTLAARHLLTASVVLTDESLDLPLRIDLAKAEIAEAMTGAERTFRAIVDRENEPSAGAPGSPVPAPDPAGDTA